MILSPTPGYIAVHFFNAKPYLEVRSSSLFIPDSQWVNIQLGVNLWNGYDLRVYDMLGRMLSRVTIGDQLYPLKFKTKQVSILNGFNGQARQLLLVTERRALPFQVPPVSILKNQTNTNSRCAVYVKFEQDSVFAITNQNSTQYKLVNYCKNASTSFVNLTLKGVPVYKESAFTLLQYSQTAFSMGLLTGNEALYDGIACNDGNMVNVFNSRSSFIKGESINITNTSTSITLEFWFKLSQSLTPIQNQSSYLFNLYGMNQKQDAFSIVMDQETGYISCNIGANDRITLMNYTSGWAHLSCSFNVASGLNAQVYLNDSFTEIEISSINGTNSQYSLPADVYEVYMGNNKGGQSGTPGLMIRDLRLWSGVRADKDLTVWRHRALDAYNTNTTSSQLMANYRLDEGLLNGGFENFATLTSNTTGQDLSLVSDSDSLIVCPMGSYPNGNFTKCHQDPLSPIEPQVSIYQLYDQASDSVMWKFEAKDVEMVVNDLYLPYIETQWSFGDAIVNSIIEPSSGNKTLNIPANAFRENAKYNIVVAWTNKLGSFRRIKELTFVPVSCWRFTVSGVQGQASSPEGAYLNYTEERSFENITFSLDFLQMRSYCPEIAFYKDFVPGRLGVKIIGLDSFTQTRVPQLETTWDEVAQKFLVKIPKSQQYLFPLFKDVKIIFSFAWENKEHADLFPSQNLTFQNAKMTIRFNKEGSMLVPIVTPQSQVLMNPEIAIIDGSQTYITHRTQSTNQQGITFAWLCPPEFVVLCQEETTGVLAITNPDFLTSNGTYNKTYCFTLRVTWVNTVNGVNYTDIQDVVSEALWVNASVPLFTLNPPANGVKMTADSNLFQMNVLYEDFEVPDAAIYRIDWSIVPNISAPTLSLTRNNTYLTIKKGSFQNQTNYTMSATLSLREYPVASRTKSISFVTNLPPSGGTITVDPTIGYMKDTLFTVKADGWDSSNKPMKYQVYPTSDPGGEKPESQGLSPQWVESTDTFSFTMINNNPVVVVLRDQAGEEVTKKLVIMIISKATTMLQSLKIIDLLTLKASIKIVDRNTKYSLMTSMLEEGTEMPENSTNTSENTTDYQDLFLDQVEADLSQLANDSLSISARAAIIQDSSQVISTLLKSDKVFSSGEIQRSFNIMSNLTQALQTSMSAYQNTVFNDSQDISKVAFIRNAHSAMSSLFELAFKAKGEPKPQRPPGMRRMLQDAPVVDNTTADTAPVDQNSTDQGNNSTPSNDTEPVDQNSTNQVNNSTPSNDTTPVDANTTEPVNNSTIDPANNTTPEDVNTTQPVDNSTSVDPALQNDTTVPPPQDNTTQPVAQGPTPAQIAELFAALNSLICTNALTPASPQQTLTQGAFTLVFDYFPLDSTVLSLSQPGPNDTNARVDVAQLTTLSQSAISPVDNACIFTAFYAIPIFTSTEDFDQLSTSQVSSKVIFYPEESNFQADLRQLTNTTYRFDGLNLTLLQTQVNCQAYSHSTLKWTPENCATIFSSTYEDEVTCQCTSQDTLAQAVFIRDQEPTALAKLIAYLQRKPWIAILVIMLGFTTLIPLQLYRLDRKDAHFAELMEQQFSSQQRHYDNLVREINPKMLYWHMQHHIQFTRDEGPIMESLSMLTAGKAFALSHPLVNVFNRYEGAQCSRVSRYMPWLAQAAVFTLVIILKGDWFYSDNEESIDDDSVLPLIRAGLIGMFSLWPIPFAQSLIRKLSFQWHLKNKVQVADKVDSETGQTDKRVKIPPLKLQENQTAGPGEQCGTEQAMNMGEVPVKVQNAIYEQDKCPWFANGLIKLAAFGLAIASVVICGTHLQHATLSVQYVTLSAFFFGVFGSLLVSHPLYALMQLILSALYKRQYVESAENEEFKVFNTLGDSAILAYLDEIKVMIQAIEETRDPELITKRRSATPSNVKKGLNSGFEDDQIVNQVSSQNDRQLSNRNESDRHNFKRVIPTEFEASERDISGQHDITSSAMKKMQRGLSRDNDSIDSQIPPMLRNGAAHNETMMTTNIDRSNVQSRKSEKRGEQGKEGTFSRVGLEGFLYSKDDDDDERSSQIDASKEENEAQPYDEENGLSKKKKAAALFDTMGDVGSRMSIANDQEPNRSLHNAQGKRAEYSPVRGGTQKESAKSQRKASQRAPKASAWLEADQQLTMTAKRSQKDTRHDEVDEDFGRQDDENQMPLE